MLIFGQALTAAQRLERNIQIVMGHESVLAMGPTIMLGTKSIGNVPTAQTDGLNETYGEEFVSKLNDLEFRYLILHECGHKMYRHLTAWQHLYEENHRKANIACDIILNDWLNTIAAKYPDFIMMPRCGGVTGAQFNIDSTDKDVHEVYALLPDDLQGDGFDEHDWESAKELTPQEQQELAKQIDEALRQGQLLASKVGSGGDRRIDELLQPKVDWRTQLASYLLSYGKGRGLPTWRKPNRKMLTHGVYLPGQIAEAMGEIVVAVDTSGSIDNNMLKTFLTEIVSIAHLMQPEALRLLYWDTAVCADEKYEQEAYDDMAESTKPAGGGGTMVECVPKYMSDFGISPQIVVVFTDGVLGGSWGTWNCPVLWCITTKKKAPIGSTLHIDL